MLPVPSSRSSPPIRWTRPGVPGVAHGRASFSSRSYGRNPPPFAGAVANRGSIVGRPSTSGICHGSDEFDRNVSDSRITGVRYVTAMRAASIAVSKQSAGDEAARIGSGDSP